MGTFLLIIITIAYLFVCLFLIGVVLMQEGKSGGLSGMTGGGGGASPLSDTLGAYAAEKTLRSWTKWAAVGFMILAILLTAAGPALMRSGSLAADLDRLPAAAGQPAPAPAEQPAAGANEAQGEIPVAPGQPQAPTGDEAEPAPAPPAPVEP